MTENNVLSALHFNEAGLIAAIAVDHQTESVLMMAWMNREARELTVSENRAVYWSRSRQKLWRKGEESGNVQLLKELRLDCDNDVILIQVKQLGGIACHTGRASCFYSVMRDGQWQAVDAVIKDPKEIYQ